MLVNDLEGALVLEIEMVAVLVELGRRLGEAGREADATGV